MELRDLAGLRDSIFQHGLFSPILVREVGRSTYEVVVGHRRLKAFEDLGLPTIPAKVIKANDRESYEIFLAENVQRDALDPLDEARAFYDYACSEERHGLGYGSITELAKRIGKSQEYVSNRISLLRLPESTLRQLLDEKKLTVSHMEELASISNNPTAVKELADLIGSHRISVRVLEKAVQLIRCGIETSRAVELAEIESGMKVESSGADRSPDRVITIMRRTKRVLEATLAYLDNTSPELEGEAPVYRYWLENVRLPVHRAIDGAIVCMKRTGAIGTASASRRKARGKRKRSSAAG